MPQGLQVWDQNGVLRLTLNSRITRRIGAVTTVPNQSGSIVVPTGAGDLIWAAPQPDYSLNAIIQSRPPIVTVNQSQKTISWNANPQTIQIDYGVY